MIFCKFYLWFFFESDRNYFIVYQFTKVYCAVGNQKQIFKNFNRTRVFEVFKKK